MYSIDTDPYIHDHTGINVCIYIYILYIYYIYMAVDQNWVWNIPRCSRVFHAYGTRERRN